MSDPVEEPVVVAPVVKTTVIPPEPETFSKDYVKELRAEAKSTRLKLAEAEQHKADALKAVDDANKAAENRFKEVNTAAEQRIIRAELKATAIKAGMIDVDGLKLADLSKVKLNDNGEIEGADALMDDLKKAKPYLFGTQSTSRAEDPPPPGKTVPKSAMEMTKAEFDAALREAKRRK